MKKKHHYIAEICEFLFISFFLVLPPLSLAPQNTVNLTVNYDTYAVFFRAIVIIYLTFRLYDNSHKTSRRIKSTRPHTNIPKFLQLVIQTVLVLGLLFAVSMIFSYISSLLGNVTAIIQVSPPQTIVLWLWFIFGTIIFACFEEILFRRYLPDQARYFINTLNNKVSSSKTKKSLKIALFFVELLFIILFALAHRYMGFFAILTALCSAIVLRLSVCKFDSLIPACIAHSVHNLLAFLLIFYG